MAREKRHRRGPLVCELPICLVNEHDARAGIAEALHRIEREEVAGRVVRRGHDDEVRRLRRAHEVIHPGREGLGITSDG
ncbi:unknown [Collinsella sp. CAG:398]|nr:unknown [Collinsella sp. CAG:398]